MDTDRKITDKEKLRKQGRPGPDEKQLVEQSKAVFLRQLVESFSRATSFDLDEEFAKTRANRSPKPFLVLLALVLGILGLLAIITIPFNRRADQLQFAADDEQDFRLRGQSENLASYEKELRSLQQIRRDLQREFQWQMSLIDSWEAKRIELARTSSEPNTSPIQLDAAQQRIALTTPYEDALTLLDSQIASEQQKIDTLGDIQEIQAQLNLINPQRSTQLLEIAFITDKYEREFLEQYISDFIAEVEDFSEVAQEVEQQVIDRYNPSGSEELVELLARDPSRPALNYLNTARVTGEALTAIEPLFEYLADIPFINTTEESIDRITSEVLYANTNLDFLADVTVEAVRRIEQLETRLADVSSQLVRSEDISQQYLTTLEALAERMDVSGFIITADEEETVQVFISTKRLVNVSRFQQAYVLRNDIVLAEIELGLDGENVQTGRIIRQHIPESLMPLDTIILVTTE